MRRDFLVRACRVPTGCKEMEPFPVVVREIGQGVQIFMF